MLERRSILTFIWDFAAGTVMEEIIDWFYDQIVGFLGNFFAEMGNMGADLFEMPWVQNIVLFFSYFAWALYVIGIVVAVFECGIEYQNGRGSIRDTALNVLKGFLAVGMFTLVPIELYKLAVSLQSSLTLEITGYADIGSVAGGIMATLTQADGLEAAMSAGTFGFDSISSPLLMLFALILMVYAVVKVFFANLKRGGILLIEIVFGSLYMFSVPRGYIDGFTGWCKQIIGLCMAAFLQSTILIAGLLVLKDHALLGLGLMLSASEIPRIAGAFGLDTSTRANIMSAVYSAQAAVNMTRTVIQVVK